MTITWYGHSCFRIETTDGSVVFDPYSDGSVPGYAPLRLSADAVFCSHDHRDHNGRQNVTLSGRRCPFVVQTISTFHDGVLGAKRGNNTVHILACGGLRAAHLGDLGHGLSGEKLAALRGVDVLMIPVGGYYTIDAKTAKKLADAIGARIVFPMHYRLGGMGYPEIGELSEYTSLCQNVTYSGESRMILSAETPAQTVVLRCANG